MSWQAQDLDNDGLADDVVLTVKTAWRSTFISDVSLTFDPSISSGNVSTPDKTITFVGGNETESNSDYAFQTTVYEVLNFDLNTEYLVSYNAGNRIEELKNNGNGRWSVQTTIQMADGNLPPSLEFPIIYEVPQKNTDGSTLTNWTFDVDALDQNADSVRYRMANLSELGAGTSNYSSTQTIPFNATGLSIDATSGLITWSGSGNRTAGLYSGGIVAEDFDSNGDIVSKSHVDFVLDLRDASEFQLARPAQISDSRNEIVEKGTQSTFSFDGTGFSVVALGDAQGALVETSPNNFTFTAGTFGSPLDPGVYPVTFEVNDSADDFTNSYYSINFIVPHPDAPIISNLQDDRTPYFAIGTAVAIDSNQDASITDTVNIHFNGGKLKLNLSNSDYANETLAINSEGTGTGEISVSGSTISYGSLVIGSIDTTLNGVNNILSIDFTSIAATLEAVAALVQQLTYTNSVEAADRDLTLFIQDSDGLSNFYSLYLQAVSLENSQVSVAPASVAADGTSEATITVALLDSSSRAFSSSGGTVVISSDIGTVSAVTDNADGTYTAILSGTTSGTATISATVNAAAIVDTASVEFLVGPASGSTTSVDVSDSTPTTDESVTVTVQAIDAQGNNLTSGGDSVLISSTQGSITSTVDNTDGTYTATLTKLSSGPTTVSATINTVAVADTELVTFSAGAANAVTSSTDVDNATPSTDDTVIVTVQAIDSNGNNLTTGGDTVVFTTSLGTISSTTDVGDGTYTAGLTYTSIGAPTVSASVNGTTLDDSEIVTFSAGAADPASSTVTVSSPASTTDDTVTVTLQTADANGNLKTSGGDTIVFGTTLGSVSSTTDNGNGSYTALLSSSSTGAATVSALLNGTTVSDTESVSFSAGAASGVGTTLSVSDSTPSTDDSVTVVVQAVDAQGNNRLSGGDSVVISVTAGTISSTTDNSDGTYSATLTRTETGNVTVSATINAAAVTDTALVTYSPGAANTTTSMISASDSSPSTNDTVIVTVQAVDGNGNDLTAGGDTVVIATSAGSITATTDVGNGTYTAELTNTSTGDSTVTATIDGTTLNDSAIVTFAPGSAEPATSSLVVSSVASTTDNLVTVTLQAVDANGNPKTIGGDTIVFSTSLGSVTDATDNNDGSYTAQLSSSSTGEATVSASLNGTAVSASQIVTFDPGSADPATSVLSVASNEISSIESTVVTLQAKDQYGNDLTQGGLPISFTTSLGTLSSPVVDNEDGSYTVTLSSSTSGIASISAQIDGALVEATVNVQVYASVADPAQSTVTSSPDLLVANGSNTSVITVQMVDASGNLLDSGDDSLTLASDLGSISDVVNNNDGTYTATYTAPAKLGQVDAVATLTSTINGEPGNSASIALTLNPAGDEDDDGVLNSVEGTSTDTDADGTPDYLDEDDDNDGIKTIDETTTDTDEDGTPNYLDTDSDDDGVPDIIEADRNDDGDALPNYLDTDSDNDGIPDAVETGLPALSGTDSDADGIDDALDVDATEGLDADQNGIDDRFDVRDADGDSIPDYLDVDSDNDGIPDALEGFADTDEDGIADYLDEDSNNDGISDRVAANISGIDTDADGISDEFDVDNTRGNDENGDGVDDAASLADLDTDGIPDVQDSDIDGDGVNNTQDRFPQDFRESSDADNDGLGDNEDDDDDNDGYTDEVEAANGTSSTDSESLPSAVDTDGDLIADSLERGNDTDGDGIEDYLEVDSDNDGIFDHIEASLDTEQSRLIDKDNDGRVDAEFADDIPLLFVVEDTDNDGVDDYRDLDSDNDGISDAIEAAPRQGASLFNDASTGLFDDAVSNAPASAYRDVDDDAIENFRDLDSDNDDISDLIEAGGTDADGDGRQDDFIDINQDGFSDQLISNQLAIDDTDTDGLPDFIDLDSDQDGLSDVVESAGTDNNRDGRVDGFIDLNGDGWTDTRANLTGLLVDTDNDGIPNFQDLDSDNDGVFDLVESGQPDLDGNGIVDLLDGDGDGIPDGVDVDVTGGTDADNDGIDDRFDTSFSDQLDTDNDGIIDQFDTDANGDGLADQFTSSEPGLGAALPDSDNDGIADVFDQSEDRVHIGLSGSGCSIASSSGSDPIFWILVVLAGLYFAVIKRYRKAQATGIKVILVLIGATLSGSIQADDQRGLYLGFGAASTSLKPEVEGSSFTVTDTSSAGWHALIGYRFHRRWQAELDYAELGEATLSPASTLEYSEINVSVLYDAWKGNVFGGRDNLALFGRLGAGKLSGESSLNIVEDSSLQAMFGLGVDLRLSQRFTVRAEAVSYDKDAKRLGIALLYRIGVRNHGQPSMLADSSAQANDSTVVRSRTAGQMTADEEPTMAAAQAKQSTPGSTVTLVRFDVDSSTLNTAQQKALQNLARDVASTPVRLLASGHADSSGPSSYNDQLSKERAKSVRNYLILHGVGAESIKSIGHGETAPIADNASPEGRARNRRVEINVSREVVK